jgi:hypothetical protein
MGSHSNFSAAKVTSNHFLPIHVQRMHSSYYGSDKQWEKAEEGGKISLTSWTTVGSQGLMKTIQVSRGDQAGPFCDAGLRFHLCHPPFSLLQKVL